MDWVRREHPATGRPGLCRQSKIQNPKSKIQIVLALVAAGWLAGGAAPARATQAISNGSFDAGLTGWTAGTRPDAAHGGAPALYPPSGWIVSDQAQISGNLSLPPLDGATAFSSFDGAPAGLQHFLAQPFTVSGILHGAPLAFTYDITGIGGTGKPDPTSPSGFAQRSFDVMITDPLGNDLARVYHHPVPVAGSQAPRQVVSMDIGSVLNQLGAGSYRLEFRLISPEKNAGPALFSLDDVSLDLVADRPPTATCPGNLQVETRSATAPVTLTGSGSDPDGDPVTLAWKEGDVLLGTGPVLHIDLSLGESRITLVATDPYGATATCQVIVDVVSTPGPTIVCPADITITGARASGAVVTYPAPTVFGGIGAVEVVASPASGSTFPVGTTPVTCTATDSAGNKVTCSFSVTVLAAGPLKITCPAAIQRGTDAGQCTAVVSFTPTVTGGIAPVKVECSPPSGSRFPIGSTMVTCTATDADGNQQQCSFQVTVADREPPAITQCAPAQTAVPDASCQAAVPDFTAAVKATDNCTPSDSLVITQSPAAGSKVGAGKTTVTLTVTDAAGNSKTCSTTFTVMDVVAPTITTCPPAQSATADARCQAAVPDFRSALQAADDCTPAGSLVITQSPAPGTLVGPGQTTVTLTVTDAAGNRASCTTTFTVTDPIPPAITRCAPAQTGAADANGQAAVPDFTAGVQASDNCTPSGSLMITQSPVAGTKVGLGKTTVTLTVTDAAGNSTTCTTSFTVSDTTPPTIAQCAPAQSALVNGNCQAPVPDFTAGLQATDNTTPTAGLKIRQSPPAGTLVGPGQTLVTLTVTDAAGNDSRCTTSFSVSQAMPPSISQCPSAQSAAADARCQAAVPDFRGGLRASDTCTPPGSLMITQSPAAGTKVGLGQTTVTLTVMDGAGLMATCTTTFTVSDTTAPSITRCPPAQSASADANCQAAVPDFTGGVQASDNCTASGSLLITQSPVAGTKVGPGKTTVTLTVTDGAGNSTTCTTSFTVSDTTPPAITTCPPAQTAAADTNCQAVVPDFTAGVQATDNCTPGGSLVITQSPKAGTKVGPGQTTVTLTVVDAAGKSSTCTTSFTVTQTTAPSITRCAPAQSAAADANCQAPVPDFRSGVQATDNCTSSSSLMITQSPAPGTKVGLGSTTITLTVTDAAGNSTTCTTSFTVSDTTPPAITTCPSAQSASADANCQAAVPDFTGGVQASDNCTPSGSLLITQSPVAGTKVGLGKTTVTLTVTDAAGNSKSCTSSFTVTDTTPPMITQCPPAQSASANANCQAPVPDFTRGVTATDNCTAPASLIITQSPAAGTKVGLGTTTVTLTVMDAAGNRTTCTTTFTVSDTTPPAITTCPSAQSGSADANCQAAVPDFTTSLKATDNCTPAGSLMITQSPAAGTKVGLGKTMVTLTVTDAAGNSSTCTSSFTVMDTTAPVITPFGDLAERVGPVVCTAWTPTPDEVMTLLGATATDQCDGAVPTSFVSRSDGKALGDPFPIGTTTITWAAVDQHGNRGTGQQHVVVTAPESWTLVPQTTYTIWVSPQATMGALALPTQIQGDHCDVQVTCSPPWGTMLAVGSRTTVTCTAMDPNGRVQKQQTVVTVQRDTTPPDLQCPGDIVQMRQFINGAYVDFNVTATDNSGFVTIFCSPPLGSLFPVGTTPVTCTAVDAFGNSSTCMFTVTITP